MEPSAKQRILVIEDDVMGALALQHDLQELGYEVPLVAGTNEEVQSLVKRWQPDVIVAALPSLSSPHSARLTAVSDQFPLVLLTDAAQTAELTRSGRFGGAGYLARPYTQAQLQGIIEISCARHRLRDALGLMRQWFVRGLENDPHGLIVLDPGSRIIFVNPTARDWTGLNDTDVAGKNLDEVFGLADEQAGVPILDPVSDVLRTNRLRRLPPGARLLARNSTRLFVARAIAPVVNEQGLPIAAVLSFHKEGEAPPPVSAEGEKLRLHTLAGLLGAIAHDFNNALGLLNAHPELLKHYAHGPGEFFAPLESIQTSIQQAYLLTGQTMAIGRLGATSFGDVDLRKTTGHLLVFSRFPSGAELEVDIPPGLWKVRGDEVQIIQAIHNLLVRGRETLRGKGQLLLRFSNLPAGSHELPQALKSAAPGQAYVRMLVADSGEAIPPEDAKHLFEPEVARRYGTSGIGLIATKTIVDNHHGWIEARSEQGVGNILAVYWPALTDRISTPERFERPGGAARSTATVSPLMSPGGRPPPPGVVPSGVTRPPGATVPGFPMANSARGPVAGPVIPPGTPRVLIIDDEELVRNSVSGMFKVLGFHADTAWDGTEGVQKFIRARDSGHAYVLVVVDLVVPLGMGAEAAIKELQKVDPALKAIVTSGYTDHPVVSSFRNYGFGAFLKKPFGLREIKAALQAMDIIIEQ